MSWSTTAADILEPDHEGRLVAHAMVDRHVEAAAVGEQAVHPRFQAYAHARLRVVLRSRPVRMDSLRPWSRARRSRKARSSPARPLLGPTQFVGQRGSCLRYGRGRQVAGDCEGGAALEQVGGRARVFVTYEIAEFRFGVSGARNGLVVAGATVGEHRARSAAVVIGRVSGAKARDLELGHERRDVGIAPGLVRRESRRRRRSAGSRSGSSAACPESQAPGLPPARRKRGRSSISRPPDRASAARPGSSATK